MVVDLEKRMKELSSRLSILELTPSPKRRARYSAGVGKYNAVNEGEIPWWTIDDPVERKRIRHAQQMRNFIRLHPGSGNARVDKWMIAHPQEHAEHVRKYHLTPKGRGARALVVARRRERSTDPQVYAERIVQLHANHEPCARCSAPYSISHQVDHILALCLGGTDDLDNFQPLCTTCHYIKSAEDRRKYMGLPARTKLLLS